MDFLPPAASHIFRTTPPPEGAPGSNVSSEDSPHHTPQEDEQIVCRQCYHLITRPEEKIQIEGSHLHSFANPHGLIFEIGCFQTAEGCGSSGQTTREYTWFRGFAWRVAVCGKCLTQLGWQFVSSMGTSRFYGLILDRIISPEK